MPSLHSASSTHSNCSINSATSIVSQTSTVDYEHEPFDQYVSKVQLLCRKLWPSATEDFEIERLQGGSYNRIIGIKPPASTSSILGRYILRVPRFDQGQQDRELAILRYVRAHTSIPVADVIFSDPTDENPLGSPYVIQNRLLGSNLFSEYPTLTHEQQKTIAKEFARILLAQQAVKNREPGVVEASTTENGTYTYSVGRFLLDEEPSIRPEIQLPSDSTTVCNMFVTQFKLLEASTIQHYPKATLKASFYSRLATVAEEMDEAGLFKDMSYCLCHLDLMPRNMMVEVGDDASARISGVLDWDSAVFAPTFIACSPPSWIWAWAEDEEEDPSKANDTPESLEMQDLKRVFEESVGPQFLAYAYRAEYQLARQLFELALHGITSNDAIRDTQKLLKEWARMKVNFGLTTDDAESSEDKERSGDEYDEYQCPSEASFDKEGDHGEFEDDPDEHEASTVAVEKTAACLEEIHME